MKQSNKTNNILQSDKITALYLRLSRDDDAVIQIGSLALSSRFLAEDLALTLTEANCRTGLLSYIEKLVDTIMRLCIY